MSEFIHLHLHTDYSLLDGACDVEKLVARVKALNMPAVAITDHGNIFGACTSQTPRRRPASSPSSAASSTSARKTTIAAPPEGDTYNHLLRAGRDRRRLSQPREDHFGSSLHGFYYKPRISKKFLAEHSKGLIGLSGCLKGEVRRRADGRRVRNGAQSCGQLLARSSAKKISSSKSRTRASRRSSASAQTCSSLEQELGIPMVATNDSHYLCEDDAHAHDVMVCIQTGKYRQ